MRRRAGGAGCGARGFASQAKLREAPGHRPPQLRGAAHQELDAGRTNAGQSLRDQGEGYPSPSGPGSHGPGAQNRRRGAPAGAACRSQGTPRAHSADLMVRLPALRSLTSR